MPDDPEPPTVAPLTASPPPPPPLPLFAGLALVPALAVLDPPVPPMLDPPAAPVP